MCVYLSVSGRAAAGKGGACAGKHWYALFVFLHRERHAVSLHEAISYLITADTLLLGGRPADPAPFHFPLLLHAKWLTLTPRRSRMLHLQLCN